jgi:hypothetical protein
MRKEFDGLSALVQEAFTEDPFSGHVFLCHYHCTWGQIASEAA